MERRRDFLPSDRVRPCLKCGALMEFRALRCPDCSQPVPGAPREEERVRACLGCEQIVPYSADPCPFCGRSAQWMDLELTRVKPCAECGNVIPFRQLYCERCGGVSISLEDGDPEGAAVVPFEAPAPAPRSVRARGLIDFVGLVVVLGGVLTLVLACRRFW